MLFNSYEFLFIFIPIVTVGFILIHRISTKGGLLWLTFSSFGFYAWWDVNYFLLLLISIFFNYSVSKVLIKGSMVGKYKFYILWLGLFVNLTLLGYFKYANFFIGNFSSAFKLDFDNSDLIVPLAISFYTFQQIAYLVDSYRNVVPDYKLSHYVLFVTFFPQLIAGPIVHHKDLIPQFKGMYKRALENQNVQIGISIFIIGLFKKLILADGLSEYADPLFFNASSGVKIDLASAWVGSTAYMFQIYFDFSGYSDMAIGLARVFGVKLPINFNSPYKARSIISFWKRWHMTLSKFMRDYVYIPLGGNRHGKVVYIYSILVTMLLSGLWHGAGWNFVLWGLLHGLLIVMNYMWTSISKDYFLEELSNFMLVKFSYRVLTLSCILFSWILFRSNDLDTAFVVFSAMFDVSSISNMNINLIPINRVREFLTVTLLLFVVLYLPNTSDIFKKYSPALGYLPNKVIFFDILCWKPNLTNSIIYGVMGLISILHMQRIKEFIYYSF